MNVVLSIAGSDSSAGAGIQADLKTFQGIGVYGTTAITLITAQNTLGVQHLTVLPASLLQQQLESVLQDFEVCAIKIGALGSAMQVRTIVKTLERHTPAKPFFVVLDPVLRSSSGRVFLDGKALELLKNRLFPLCDLITPNLPEAEIMFPNQTFNHPAVLLKGGHGLGNTLEDILFVQGQEVAWFSAAKQHTRHLHGTGCTLSSAICGYVALGLELIPALHAAHNYTQIAIALAPGLGAGNGPLLHPMWWEKVEEKKWD